MADAIDRIAKELVKAIPSTKKTSPYDTQAEVLRVDGDTAWVHIPGGVDETPVQMTSSAKKGDIVQVRVSGGRAWLYGNATNPPTDDTVAVKAVTIANVAETKSVAAQESADIAAGAASNAWSFAESAQVFAESAQESAGRAEEYANEAKIIAQRANDYSLEANDYAQRAFGYAGDAYTYAQDAQQNASDAYTYAQNANTSATGALNSLSEVEKVVDALNWIAEHGQYGASEDTIVQAGKWYFTRSGTSPNYTYTLVENPTGNPSTSGWYELTGVDEAISNYVKSHLALTDDGLSLQTDGVDTRVLLSASDGVVIKGLGGQTLATYGSEAVIGDVGGFHIQVDGTEIGFYQSAQKVAYINGNKLYITQSVVLQQMDVGTTVAYGGLGQWSWKVHTVNNANNLYLKWTG